MELFDRKVDVAHVARNVRMEAVAENGYNLSVSSYVETKDNREVVNITALNQAIEATVTKIDGLRRDINAIVAEIEGAKA
jgi:type I restriction enzyme M protein